MRLSGAGWGAMWVGSSYLASVKQEDNVECGQGFGLGGVGQRGRVPQSMHKQGGCEVWGLVWGRVEWAGPGRGGAGWSGLPAAGYEQAGGWVARCGPGRGVEEEGEQRWRTAPWVGRGAVDVRCSGCAAWRRTWYPSGWHRAAGRVRRLLAMVSWSLGNG